MGKIAYQQRSTHTNSSFLRKEITEEKNYAVSSLDNNMVLGCNIL